MPQVPIASITIGDRLREDMGDIAGLAESIAKYGLFHPIIITRADRRLVCGHRRLLAVQRLGWLEIDASEWEGLDEETRREIEREENERRKPLTDVERSKRLVQRAAEAAPEIAERKAERVSVTVTETAKHSGGRPPKADVAREEVAQALGVSEPTLRRAESHVAAVESTPALAPLPQAKALRAAEALRDPEVRAAFDAVPEPERPVVAAMIAEPGAPADGARRSVEGYAALPQERRAAVQEAVARKDMDAAITASANLPPMPDRRLGYIDDALQAIDKARRATPGGHESLAAATNALLEFRRVVKEGIA